MRKFNTTGPCFPDEHYMLPALDRLPGICELVADGNCFVIHAPRQTGKTTALKALVREINEKGEMAAIYCTLETLQNSTDPDIAIPKLRQLLLRNARAVPSLAHFASSGDEGPARQRDAGWTVTAVSDTLADFCLAAGKPLVVFFDEADCLAEDVLISFLQRVTNGGGHINREMALGQGRLDLCVEFRGARYAVEVKTSDNFKDEKSYAQCAKYLDTLKLSEGWMPIFDKSKTKSWDEKIYARDVEFDGKTIHVIGL